VKSFVRIDNQGQQFAVHATGCWANVFHLALGKAGDQKYRQVFAMKIMDDPNAAAFTLAPDRPSKLSQSARTLKQVARQRVSRHKVDDSHSPGSSPGVML
jgi:hypothetical protein